MRILGKLLAEMVRRTSRLFSISEGPRKKGSGADYVIHAKVMGVRKLERTREW